DPHRHARPVRRDRGRRDGRVQGRRAVAQARLHLGLGRSAGSAAVDRARVLRAGQRADRADDQQQHPDRRAGGEPAARLERLLRQPRTPAGPMSTTASENRPSGMPRSAAAWPVVVLAAIAGGCWAVTVERMEGMDMGPGTDLGGLGWFAVVWLTMMAAMMLPSLSPMAVARSRGERGGQARSIVRNVLFAPADPPPSGAFALLPP